MVEMGNLCEKVISGAIKVTMSDKDGKLAHEVLETDSEIDRKEREIENICMKLLLRQQPVARDLRVISSAAHKNDFRHGKNRRPGSRYS